MTADEVKAWTPIIQTFGGIVGSLLTGVLVAVVSHVTTSRRDRKNQEIEGKERRERLWIEYQIESMRALQDAAQGMMALPVASIARSGTIEVHRDITGMLGALSDFAEHKVTYHDSHARFVKHHSRIDDMQIRQADERFLHHLMGYYEKCSNEKVETSALSKAVQARYRDLNRLIGDRIHDLIRRDRPSPDGPPLVSLPSFRPSRSNPALPSRSTR